MTDQPGRSKPFATVGDLEREMARIRANLSELQEQASIRLLSAPERRRQAKLAELLPKLERRLERLRQAPRAD